MILKNNNFLKYYSITFSILFSILWGVWMLPNTVAIRHTVMVSGAIMGLYLIWKNWRMILNINLIPIALVLILICWVTFHAIFIGTEPEQWKEYFRVWKKIGISIIFAIGMGLVFAKISKNPNILRCCWQIFYVGLTLPVILYFIKYIITNNQDLWGISNPYLILDSNYQQNPYGISRALYSFYCIPSFAVAVFILLSRNLKRIEAFDYLYLASLILTPLLFFIEKDRMGLLIIFFTLIAATFHTIRSFYFKKNLKSALLFLFVICLLISSSVGLAKRFPNWPMVIENIKIATMVNSHDGWKYAGNRPFPENIYGHTVDRSTYERISWFVAGSQLLLNYPNGYGLLSLSFNKISEKEWPESVLSMTHSGFLDFALGYGLFGIVLLISAFFISILMGVKVLPPPWSYFLMSGYFSLFFVMSLKELSYEITINAFIFLIVFISAFSAGMRANKNF